MLEHCCRDLLPFIHKSISEVGFAVGIPIHPKGVDGVEVRALCKSVKFFHTNLDNFCMDLALGTGALSC